MSAGSTALIARKSVRARWGRTLAIAAAITAGVSFVVGSFVLADSLRETFADLFQELNEDVDLEVRLGGDGSFPVVWVGQKGARCDNGDGERAQGRDNKRAHSR